MSSSGLCVVTHSLLVTGDLFLVDCKTAEHGLNIVVDVSQLPATHGTEFVYTCPNTVAIDGDIKAICTDRKIVFSPENHSPCRETSTQF